MEQAKVIVTGPETDKWPLYSRDGTRVAFVRETAGELAFAVARSDGADVRRVSSGLPSGWMSPVVVGGWTPDSQIDRRWSSTWDTGTGLAAS